MAALDATAALIAAVRARLIADSGVTVHVPASAIMDRPPKNQVRPYITLGDVEKTDDSTSNTDGKYYEMDIVSFTTSPDTRPARAIQSRINALFHAEPLPITGHNVIYVQVTRELPPLIGEDGETFETQTTIRAQIGHG